MVKVCYGLTETSPVTHQSFPTDPAEKRVATVGKPHSHVEVSILLFIDIDNTVIHSESLKIFIVYKTSVPMYSVLLKLN